MLELHGKKFVASYSGGKDSALAIHRVIEAGLTPLELLTTWNTDADRSWFHGIGESLLQSVSDALGIPATLIKTSDERYEESFERALADAKSRGAEICVFGDIDIAGHIEWCTTRCERTGLIPLFPLLKEDREKLVYAFIDAGFSTLITVVDTSRLSKEFLGLVLSREVADAIGRSGADICGENGEYHTFTFDGPIFKNRVAFSIKEEVTREQYCILHIEG